MVIPLRSTLTGLMYEKLMRIEDSLHVPKKVGEDSFI